MNERPTKQPRWILAGAGNAHLRLLRALAMDPLPGVEVTLVNRTSRIVYSAMLPRVIAGELRREEIEIDLSRFCDRHGFHFRVGEIASHDAARRELSVKPHGRLPYDFLSVSVGSQVRRPPGLPQAEHVLEIKPLDAFAENLERAIARRYRRWVIVGGGASGCEIALALAKRLQNGAEVTLLNAGGALVSKWPSGARRRIEKALKGAGVTVRPSADVERGDSDRLHLTNGDVVPYEVCILATPGGPPTVLAQLSLPQTENGFLSTDETLLAAPGIFAAGDCIQIRGKETLPRNGVYAVRQGETLHATMMALLAGRGPAIYRPQKRTLNLFNLADGRALLTYGRRSWSGKALLRWKERIDRKWLAGFQMSGTMPSGEMGPMRCGGCGSKVPAGVLRSALGKLEIASRPEVLAHCQSGEDVGVHQPPPNRVEVQTIDFFKSFVDDARLFGELSAIHALNDVHAVNAEPWTALAVCSLPFANAEKQQELLAEMLTGANAVLKEHRTTLTGGHTSEAESLGMGLCVTGYAEANRLFRKHSPKPGEVLLLTKPLGTGALLAALMRNIGQADWYEKLFQEMRRSNATAARIFSEHAVTSCTDISGFGLCGHLKEMIGDSPMRVHLEAREVPLYAGFEQVAREGILSTLHPANRADAQSLEGTHFPEWLFDPQTCGGLLAALAPSEAERALSKLQAAGYTSAAIIGRVESALGKSSILCEG